MTSSNRISPDDLARPDFAAIPRYATEAGAEIDLGDNTNQWGPPPAAAAALRQGLDLARYPDMYGDSLKRTIARMAGFGPEAVRQQKRLLNKWLDMTPRSAIEDSVEQFGLAFLTGEPQHHMTRFTERQAARRK